MSLRQDVGTLEIRPVWPSGYGIDPSDDGRTNIKQSGPGQITHITVDGVSVATKVRGIGWAVKELRNGAKVRRAGWNKGMFLMFVPGRKDVEPAKRSPYAAHGFVKVDIEPHIDMFTAAHVIQPGWLCSQADLLATDWEIAE
jgi:hypothetical protein